ncbi:Protein TIFY 9 [Hirschfeldia incana]|nr:Protein TIFY 9 [Hirschfeldia incana]
MSKVNTELDFFGLEKKQTNNAPKPKFMKFLDRRRSFREIQGAISKMDPEIIKSLLASGANPSETSTRPPSVPSTPKEDHPHIPISPVHAPVTRPGMEPFSGTVPMTIFYNGTVSVFQVSPSKAEDIMKVAMETSPKKDKSTEKDLSIFPLQGESHCKGFLRSARRE